MYFLLAGLINYSQIWRSANEWDVECEHPPFPTNKSGVKVIVAGWGKSGTETMSRTLGQLGLKSYHGAELRYHIWSPIADEYWMRPENGGRRSINAAGTTSG